MVCETAYFASMKLVYFSLIMLVINNLDNFKTNSSLHNFNTRSKTQLCFLSVILMSVKNGVTYSAIKIFNYLLSNILELQENKTVFKSAHRQ
jgi:hypothetical protein